MHFVMIALIVVPGWAHQAMAQNVATTYTKMAPVDQYLPVHVQMMPSRVATAVTVSGTETQVQTTTQEISSTISGEEAQELPLNGRNFEQLGSLMPGVINSSPVATMGTGGYSTSKSLLLTGGTNTGNSGAGEIGAIYNPDGLWIISNVVHDENIVMPNLWCERCYIPAGITYKP